MWAIENEELFELFCELEIVFSFTFNKLLAGFNVQYTSYLVSTTQSLAIQISRGSRMHNRSPGNRRMTNAKI